MKNLHCNDLDGNILSIGDKVVMLDTSDLEGKIPSRCEVLEVTNCLDTESNYISFNNEYSFFGHRVLKLVNL